MAHATAVIDYALQVATYAMRTTVHRTLGISPGSLVFQRDMMMDLPFVAVLHTLRNKRQELIDYNLRRENYKRRSSDSQPGQWVLELVANPTKLGLRTQGPYRVERVHCNGTLTIRRTENMVDRLNI